MEQAAEHATRDPIVRGLAAMRWLFDVLPGSAGAAVWNFWVRLENARFHAVYSRALRR